MKTDITKVFEKGVLINYRGNKVSADYCWIPYFVVRARPCFQDGVFRVPKNGMLETNKPLAMRVVGNALAYRKNLQCYNNVGSPTTLQAEVSIWI